MRIVVKVGTSTLAHSTGRLNIRHVERLVKVLSDLKNAGHEIVLVSSGAIGMGCLLYTSDRRYTARQTGQPGPRYPQRNAGGSGWPPAPWQPPCC